MSFLLFLYIQSASQRALEKALAVQAIVLVAQQYAARAELSGSGHDLMRE